MSAPPQQMALPLAAQPSRPALVHVTVPAALTDARREQYRRLIARLVGWPPKEETQHGN